MNIKELSKQDDKLKSRIERLEERRYQISILIAERWKFLISTGCGYFKDWHTESPNGQTINLVVHYERPRGGGPDTDTFPVACFETDNLQEAKNLWLAEIVRREEYWRTQQTQKDMAELERLKAKLGQ